MPAAFFSMAGLLLLFDFIWVSLHIRVRGGLYHNRINGPLANNKIAIVVLWTLMAVVETALLWYVLQKPDMQTGNVLAKAAQFGALAGFAIYFVFNGTSLFTSSTWSVSASIGDICWGTVLMTSVAVLGAHVIRQTKPQTFDPAITNPAAL
jgi:uncharacterized membrane protein